MSGIKSYYMSTGTYRWLFQPSGKIFVSFIYSLSKISRLAQQHHKPRPVISSSSVSSGFEDIIVSTIRALKTTLRLAIPHNVNAV